MLRLKFDRFLLDFIVRDTLKNYIYVIYARFIDSTTCTAVNQLQEEGVQRVYSSGGTRVSAHDFVFSM